MEELADVISAFNKALDELDGSHQEKLSTLAVLFAAVSDSICTRAEPLIKDQFAQRIGETSLEKEIAYRWLAKQIRRLSLNIRTIDGKPANINFNRDRKRGTARIYIRELSPSLANHRIDTDGQPRFSLSPSCHG